MKITDNHWAQRASCQVRARRPRELAETSGCPPDGEAVRSAEARRSGGASAVFEDGPVHRRQQARPVLTLSRYVVVAHCKLYDTAQCPEALTLTLVTTPGFYLNGPLQSQYGVNTKLTVIMEGPSGYTPVAWRPRTGRLTPGSYSCVPDLLGYRRTLADCQGQSPSRSSCLRNQAGAVLHDRFLPRRKGLASLRWTST